MGGEGEGREGGDGRERGRGAKGKKGGEREFRGHIIASIPLCSTHCPSSSHLWVEHIGVHGLVVVVGVASLVETGEGILEDLVEGGLAPSCGAHTHHTMPHQLGLIQLYHLVHLWRGDVWRREWVMCGGVGDVWRCDVWRDTCVTFKCLTTLKYTSLILDV